MTPDLEGPLPCTFCGKPALPDYPHHHATPPRPDFDPMPARPPLLTDLLLILGSEYRAELPDRLHSHQVPDHTEPIPVSLSDPDGPQVDVTDSGPLGGAPFSPAFHRRIGANRFMGVEMVQSDQDLRPFPFTRQLEGVRRWCAGKHRTWYEHQGKPLCWTLLRHIAIGGYAIGRAAELEGISEEKARELVEVAAGKWWVWVQNDMMGLDMRPVRRPAA